jgi:hypothetical protein
MEWEIQVITLYCDVVEQYQSHLWRYCERMSNNSTPDFTDEEVITIYLFGIQRKRKAVKEIYEYTRDHLAEWFPLLPSYEGYVHRLNTLSSVFPPLLNAIAPIWQGRAGEGLLFLLDSMPIILAQGSRRYQAKVAPEVADCGYCASKDLHYYGLKLHLLGIKQPDTLPHPEYLELTSARPHDITVLHAIVSKIWHGELFADKAYVSEVLAFLLAQQQVNVHTPPKKAKGQDTLALFDRLLSTAISRVRQPIESFFQWLEEHTGIQMASKVRSLKGLLVHVYGRLTAAMYLLAFNS